MSRERAVYAVVLSALLVASVFVAVIPADDASPESPDAAEAEFEVTDDGTRYTVDPDELRQGCPGGTDCIPSIDDPSYQSAEEATWLEPDDQVIGVSINGETKAFPLRVLAVHEVVNDRIGGEPVAVTYCPLCRSGVVFSRNVGNGTVTFGVSGKLLDANLVLYDRQTESYWSQIEGEAIVGPMVPQELEQVPNTITTWKQWREAHPDTDVLSRDTGIYPKSTYDTNPYAGYANSSRVGFGVGPVDDRLPEKAIVYGVTANGTTRAYPEEAVRERDVVNDRVGDVPVLVVEDPSDGSIRVFVREIDGEALRFEAADGGLVDREGNRWSFDGRAESGPHDGRQLERLDANGFYWFAWSKFHSDTEVYGLNETR